MGHKYINENGTITKNQSKFEKIAKNNPIFDENKRFFVENCENSTIVIDGEEHNHIANVMRFAVGDKVILVCGDEFDYHAKIVEINKKNTVLEIESKAQNKCNPSVDVTAFVALNKREQTSLMIRMLSELGISHYIPFASKWTQSTDAIEKIDRYKKIADQSIKQCRRSKALSVEETKKFADMLKCLKNYDIVFFANEDEQNVDLNNFEQYLSDNNLQKTTKDFKNIAFIIGPVAGFDFDEEEMIKQSGAVSISLGKRILRADTACVALASIIMNKFDR